MKFCCLFQTKKNTEENGTSMKKSRPKPSGGGLGLLPPPPGGVKLAPPGGAGLSLGSCNIQPNNQQKTQTVTNSAFPSSNNSSSNSGSNVDLLLDLGFDNSSQGQTTVGQGQSQGQIADSNFDLLMGTNDKVKPAGGSADPWGEFTGAR